MLSASLMLAIGLALCGHTVVRVSLRFLFPDYVDTGLETASIIATAIFGLALFVRAVADLSMP